MSYNDKVINKVLNDYDNKAKNALMEMEKRKSEIYKKLPELLDIDKKMAGTYSELVNIITADANSKEDVKSKIDAVKEKNMNLQKQRKMLLEFNGYPQNHTEPLYECFICQDTGYIKINDVSREETMCDCLKKALAAESLNESGLGKMVKAQNFENFNLNYYEKTPQNNGLTGNEKESPFKRMKNIFETCKRFADNFGTYKNNAKNSEDLKEQVKNLMFIGPTGLGKTHLSSAIAFEIIKKGFDVFYDTAQSILYSFEKARFSKAGTFDQDIIERYMTCDLLIIDDLGTEYSGNMSVSSLYNLVNTRLIENKSMIISTNLNPQEMNVKYDDSIVSRIFGNFTVLHFAGDDIRYKKL